PGWRPPHTFDDLPQPAYPVGAPGVGDLDGHGSPEIVLCVVSDGPPRVVSDGPPCVVLDGSPRRNFLYAFHADGSVVDRWPVEICPPGWGYYTCSAAGTLLADLHGDRRMEVARGMSQGDVQVFDGGGKPLQGWPYRFGPDAYGWTHGLNADLTAADLDGDGRPELIAAESGFAPRLVALSGDGRALAGFPISLPEVIDRQAPAVADLDRDPDGRPEIVQATLPFSGDLLGTGEPSPGGPPMPAELRVLHADGTAFVPWWQRTLQSGDSWGAVLADLTGDGRPEIVLQDGGLLNAFDFLGTPPAGFPLTIHRDFLRSQALDLSPWLVTDLDGARGPDLIQARSDVYSGVAYLRLIGLRTTGQPLKGFPFEVEGLLAASRPVAVDLTGDGIRDLVLLATEGANGGWILEAWDLAALGRGAERP
ncbi:MAG TPA: VCBS repeat-containing protein, partial [Candidatus Polarisedimenticolia bacterium]|nr:VCBS repeat-containing protein [Candidatus Polarisedimenticolia bacterium]